MDIDGHQSYYNGIPLGSNNLDTIILSGGGYFGIGYIALIKFLDDNGLRAGVRDIYGVSAGAVLGLLMAIGLSYDECRKIILEDINLSKLIEIKSRLLLNLPDRLGMNDGQYLSDTCKKILQSKGLSEYCTFTELYEQCGVDLHLGVLSIFRDKYEIWDRHTRPDMPLWHAIRATTAIPFVFMPVIDYESCDLMCDGGIVNNNLIGTYIRQLVKEKLESINSHANSKTQYTNCITQRTIGTQTDKLDKLQDNLGISSHIDISNNINYKRNTNTIKDMPPKAPTNGANCKPNIEPEKHKVGGNDNTHKDKDSYNNNHKHKYRHNFWAVELCFKRYEIPTDYKNLDKIGFAEYLGAIMYKFFNNQDSHRDKFRKYLHCVDCKKYNNITFANLKLDVAELDKIQSEFYNDYHTYYHESLLCKP